MTVTDERTQPPKPEHRAAIVAGGLALLLLGSAIMAWSLVSHALPGQINYELVKQVAAGRTLQVDTRNADVQVRVGLDDRIDLLADGRYTTREPAVSIATTGATTTISGDCMPGERRCSLELTITVPRSTVLRLNAETGVLHINDIAGDMDLHSIDGAVIVNGPVGSVRARTENGEITVASAQSQGVDAESVNGRVKLIFLTPPKTVSAASVNGQIDVRVPAGTAYRVEAAATNAKMNVLVDRDPASPYFIKATSTNGSVEVLN